MRTSTEPDPVGHSHQRILEGQAEALLLEDLAELALHRLGRFVRHHAEAGGKRVSRPDGAAQQVDRLGQLLLELPHSPGPLLLHHPVGQQRAHDRHQDGEQERAGERQGGQAETEADAHGGEDEALDGHRRPGLLERQAEIAKLRHPRENPAQGTALIEAAKQILAGVLLECLLAELPELLERPPLARRAPATPRAGARWRHRPQRDRQEDQCRARSRCGGQSGYHFDRRAVRRGSRRVGEQHGREIHAVRLEPVGAARPDAGRLVPAQDPLALVGPLALEDEDVLHGDDVAFHADDLGDLHDLAGAVGEPARPGPRR